MHEEEDKYVYVTTMFYYPEDSEIDGVEDDPESPSNPLITGKNENGEYVAHFRIEIDSGIISNWPRGVVARIYNKSVDTCKIEYNGVVIHDEYVPKFLSRFGSYDSDYMKFEIGPYGTIQDWSAQSCRDFINEYKGGNHV